MRGINISERPIHLGLGATAVVEPAFAGTREWYSAYAQRHSGDGVEGRVVSMNTYKGSWPMWEMHPHGSEVVLCIAGAIALHQESGAGSRETIELVPGEYAINGPGTWHTADVRDSATVLFITAGLGTQHRPR
jgi:quercetin dioxygenase-like cupin family protein